MRIAGHDVTLEAVLARLATHRPIFHSERDFQFALAWEIREMLPDVDVRLETKPSVGVQLDVEARSPRGVTGLELKYLTKPWTGVFQGEEFALKSRAVDKRRYDVVKDVKRLEQYVSARPGSNGAAVVLASDTSLWSAPRLGARITADEEFRIHDGVRLAGVRRWGTAAGPGTVRGREAELSLTGSYLVEWKTFATSPIHMRLLTVEVA
ncbi:hypothetical protein LG314_12660 [Agrococcus terreus]|uniref:hypothetical protein n=1 Tax=Agrococcus terreus TaxID=574649 RepID=UPI00384CDF99